VWVNRQYQVFTLPPLKQIEFQSDATWQEITAAILAVIAIAAIASLYWSNIPGLLSQIEEIS
jgi:hypothetical protein